MKKLFAVFALLSVFMGAKAEEVVDVEVDYSTVASWSHGWISDDAATRIAFEDGCLHFKSEEATANFYDVQFQPFPGVPSLDYDASYTITIKIKGSVAQNIRGYFSGSDMPGDIPVTTDWQELTFEGCQNNAEAQYFANTGSVLIQCGDYVGEWWISYVKISHEEKANQRPVEWIELITNGDAETPWTEDQKATKYDDNENNFTICAWNKVKNFNMNDDGGWDPYPADIEEEADGNHVFAIHAAVADTEGDASAWDNQFWILAPKLLKAGSQYKVSFRYKASKVVNTMSQFHKQTPSQYVSHNAFGGSGVAFSTDWQQFEQTVTIPSNEIWSIAFNLNHEDKEAIDFYFDDLSIAQMKLDEGYFVAGSNPNAGLEYDYENAIEFVYDEDEGLYTAVVGSKDAYVSQVMISTVRGNDSAFKGATLKPTGSIKNDPDEWLDYTEASQAKLNLPGDGIWKIYLDENYKAMSFEMLEGNAIVPIEINPNPTEIVINALERDDLADTTDSDGNVTEVREEEGGTGQTWDNQFWIVANRTLEAGEVTVIEFDYVATAEAKSTTQDHKAPGEYLHFAAIGDVNFTTEEQHFSTTFTIPSEANGMQSIAFNLSEIKAANTYTFKNIIWRTEDSTESLINQTGGENFYVKILGGNPDPVETGISKVAADKASNAAIYNIAGQRVTKAYKGLVVKDGKKYIVK
jgi:hypothetical protein